MDIVSHWLRWWLAFGRKSKKEYFSAVAWWIMPDLFSFGIFTVSTVLWFNSKVDFSKQDMNQIPDYVHILYNITHSIIIWIIVFLLLRIIFRKPIKSVFAWLLHILIDIPTHSIAFFATPFLWPISSLKIDWISRGTPMIFFTNRWLIIIFYIIWFLYKRNIIKNFF